MRLNVIAWCISADIYLFSPLPNVFVASTDIESTRPTSKCIQYEMHQPQPTRPFLFFFRNCRTNAKSTSNVNYMNEQISRASVLKPKPRIRAWTECDSVFVDFAECVRKLRIANDLKRGNMHLYIPD